MAELSIKRSQSGVCRQIRIFHFFATINKRYKTGRPVARHGVSCAKFRQVSAMLLLLETRPGTFVTPQPEAQMVLVACMRT